MALTATATQGLEIYRHVEANEVLYMLGDPGDTYTRGDAVTATVGEGVLDPAAAGEPVVGVVARTTVCPAASVAAPKPADFNPAFDSEANRCLIPIHSRVPAGTPVYKCTFASHIDEAILSYTASTRAIAGGTGAAADDYPNGALAYIYEGPGIGEVAVVQDYDHTGGAAELLYILHRRFSVAPTAASKWIVLAGEAAGSRGVGFFNRTDMADANNLAVNDGADDGNFVVYMDWRETATMLKNLTLLVVPVSALLIA